MSASAPLVCHACWDPATGHTMPCDHVLEAVQAAIDAGANRERIRLLKEMQVLVNDYATRVNRIWDAWQRVVKTGPLDSVTFQQAAAFDELVAAIKGAITS